MAQFFDPQFLRKLELLSILSKKVFKGRIKWERRSLRKGTSVEFADYRNYTRGDDFRYIDWNIYGRLDRLFLKLFEEEEDLLIYLLLDKSKSMDFGNPKKIDYAKKVIAALGYIGLTKMDRVAASAFSSGIKESFPATRGRGEIFRLFDFLSRIEPEGETLMSGSLKEYVSNTRRAGLAIVVSDFLASDGYEDALKYLMSKRFDIFVVHLLCPEEQEPNFRGDLRLIDSETGEVREISLGQKTIRGYRNVLRSFCDGLRSYCHSRGITYIRASTEVPFEELILKYLRTGGLIKK